MVLRCLGRSDGPLWNFTFSGASQETEYLSFGHSYAVWLRLINVSINYKECGYLDTSPRERDMGHSSAVRLKQ
jgi:hypothetical protein